MSTTDKLRAFEAGDRVVDNESDQGTVLGYNPDGRVAVAGDAGGSAIWVYDEGDLTKEEDE